MVIEDAPSDPLPVTPKTPSQRMKELEELVAVRSEMIRIQDKAITILHGKVQNLETSYQSLNAVYAQQKAITRTLNDDLGVLSKRLRTVEADMIFARKRLDVLETIIPDLRNFVPILTKYLESLNASGEAIPKKEE